VLAGDDSDPNWPHAGYTHCMSNSQSRPVTRLVVACGLLAVACALGACQTVKGLGQDIQYAGEKGEKAIDNASK
jgi:predicted small secreted protein